jgi:sensor domain CHASE-containing protein
MDLSNCKNTIDRLWRLTICGNDTYEFVQGKAPIYPEENFYDESLKNLGLDLVVALGHQWNGLLSKGL